ncbi:GNAT family N-acetyltransferase [Bacillus sp. Bva_UNVM-123]|uniref:GNAT family N-acetyltransferase n=1 Tax=Bacillus sp. Bva_UNVM-123 TaxID=2829798 RepID=UPI00391F547D
MGQMTNTIVIKEYHKGLARGIARMWNLSRDSWGGDTKVHTEEQVLTKEENSGNISLYLALDGEEVVGYCGLSEYKEDTGSLYIPLLNVRPDYHGKKIGKMLLMKAIEKTIELGWPRLDLYTWPGNVKAVPLYKKCGFFWEDRDDTTHLMNFIPAVINTPLLKPLFSKLNWYDNSVREIEVKPDGFKENGFSFYEYEWKNEQAKARVRFERTGRGISLIDTDEFFLELRLAEHEVIEEEVQKFEIKFINKLNKPVSLKVRGKQHERVNLSLQEEMQVDNNVTITNEVIFLKGDEPSVWKTHPYLSVCVAIDGQECELRLGVFPKQPAKISAKMDGNLSFLGQDSVIELEMENSLKEDAEFEICFSETEFLQLNSNVHSIFIKKNERKLVKIPVIVNQFGFYQPEVNVKAMKADGTELSFQNKNVGIALKGCGEKFGGESKDYWHIYNGIYQVNIRKMDYLMTAGRNQLFDQTFAFFVPKLGKPYSTEFSKQKPNKVEWHCDETAVTFKMVFYSKDFKGISLTLYIALFGEGLVKRWAEVENIGEQTYSELFLNESIYHDKKHPYIPLENEVIEFSNTKQLEFGDIHSNSVSSNWYFSEDDGEAIGFCWSKKCKANFESWQLYLEFKLGLLNPGDKHVTDPSFLSVGAFRTWQELEAFAEQNPRVNRTLTKVEQSLTIEGANMILSDSDHVSFQFKSYRTNYLKGQFEVSLNNESMSMNEIVEEEAKTIYCDRIPLEHATPISVLSCSLKSESRNTYLEHLLIKTKGEVKSYIEETDNITSYVLNNGIITIKTAPTFFPGLYSLAYNKNEWFDTSFPKLTAKGWWNPWAGGMKSMPSQLNAFSLMKEKTTHEIIELTDVKGNRWKSIALTTMISNHPKWKGLQYTQYFALLPGVPVLAYFVKIIDSGGKSLIDEVWNTDLFIKGNPLQDLTVVPLENGEDKQFHVGKEEQLLTMNIASLIQSQSRDEKMYMIKGADSHLLEGYMNKEIFQFVNTQTAKASIKPSFILFDQRELSTTVLQNLQQIEF